MIIGRHSLRDSRWWIVISLVTLFVSTVWYFVYAARAAAGPSGGSLPGLVFGGAGTLIIVFAWGLTVRKWRRSARVGRTYTWLQGHVYLSIVSYPLILYHAGFRWGGPLTAGLMWAFTVCYVSGILLLIVQQIVPRMMLEQVPLETIYDQIDRVAGMNLAAADALVEGHVTAAARAMVAVPDLGEDEFQATGRASRGPAADTAGELKAFYDDRVRPHLAHRLRPAGRGKAAGVLYAWAAGARDFVLPFRRPIPPTGEAFAAARRKMPSAGTVIEALERYAEERRQLDLQKHLQHLLHGWLLLHVPAAWVMIVLLPVHAVMAARYL